jgi:hypothetical protein
MARRAVILHQGTPGSRELRLGRILDFLGVPWKAAEASDPAYMEDPDSECAVFGSIRAVALVVKNRNKHEPRGPFYAYVDDDRTLSVSALQSLVETEPSLRDAPAVNLSLRVSDQLPAFAGPMAGLSVSARLRDEDALLNGIPAAGDALFTSIISAEDAPLFVNFHHHGASIFFCASSRMVDIDEPVGRGYYDVKDHFCSAVPLLMFIKSELREAAWQPQELSACLIIDDPLLRLNYGFCDFAKLRDLMKQNEFTTNIAFIPWNWRRTSSVAGKFFTGDPGLFSVSVHGCDHTASEFATTSLEVLEARVQLARSRMQSHQTRTGIKHDLLMVFPQGAFSSACPAVLKRNGFIGAVNTEIAPMDFEHARTRIRDVWDVAIMTYGDFPIFTRRYPFHGLENFAFDLLLGKPCLIVTHHEFFKDGCVGLMELIKGIKSLNCTLRWRPLGDVIRKACRVRAGDRNSKQIQMYGNELMVRNDSDQSIDVTIRKRESQNDVVSEVLCDKKAIAWSGQTEYLTFAEQIGSRQEKLFRVTYLETSPDRASTRTLRLELKVAARRILSELRDQYLSTNPMFSRPTEKVRGILRKSV